MTYLSRSDIEQYLPAVTLAQLTDDENGAQVNEDVLAGVLENAVEVADSYLRQRYTLPLVTVPKLLRDWVGAIARHQLYMRRPEGGNDLPPAVVRTYKDAIRFLEQLAAEKLSIGIVDSATDQKPAAAGGGRVRMRASSKMFGDDTLEQF